MLFGNDDIKTKKRKIAFDKLQSLKRIKQ